MLCYFYARCNGTRTFQKVQLLSRRSTRFFSTDKSILYTLKMVKLQLPLIVLLLDVSLNYLSAHLVYKYCPDKLLAALWLVGLIKFPVLGTVSLRLRDTPWMSSYHIYIFTMCLSQPLYQTLRLISHSPELPKSFQHNLQSHLIVFLACMLWDLLLPHIFPKKNAKQEDNESKRRRENFFRLLKYSKPDWLQLSGAFIFLTLALIGEMFIPYYMGRVIDILSTKYSESIFLEAILFMAIFSITSSFFAGSRGGLFMFSHSSLTQRLRIFLFRSLVQQEIAFFETTKTGDITSRLSQDTSRVSRAIAANVNIILRTLVKCIGVYSFMFSLSWQLTLLTFISAPFTWITQKVYNSYHQELVQKVQDSIARSSDLAKEMIESVRTVYSFAAEEEEAKRYEKSLQETHELQTRRDFVRALYLLVIRLINLSTQVALLYCGQQLIHSGYITTGKMVSFILYQMESGDYIRTLVHMLSEVTHSAGAGHKVFHYLDREPLVSNKGNLCPNNLRGKVEFKNVTFSYPSRPDVPALQNISFKLPPGSVTALVGPSGGGKTTCVSLLERFYEPQVGDILLDEIPLQEYTHQYLHSKVALVAQEPVLFAGTIRENIGYGIQDIPEKQLKEAARKAKADAFITEMEKDYDTDVGDSGAQLSAGQKQRVALARALARKPKLLILDEASSCLDAETEHEIQQSLQTIPGLSLLIIAHRLRTVQKADNILVLEGGNLVQQGTHEELVKEEGVYKRLLHGHLLQNGDQ
uniref:Transporter 2, ATP-binding cassette, sub-family B (MDR/TAP) n=2 Tax=Xenopus tropicalis TaxID=8364 RepID=A0A803K5B4_XENTR